MKDIKKTDILSYMNGFILVGLLSFFSLWLAGLDFIKSLHFSSLLVGVIVGTLISFVFKNIGNCIQKGVSFSAKRLLRLGIILYGFNVTLSQITTLGIYPIIIAIIVVIVVFGLGTYIGIKLGLDKDIAILVSGGSAVCGAAAVLALESAIKSEPYKGVIAVGTVVIFGIIAMFLYPILYNLGLIPFDHIQEGIYIGATLHEVANVAGAASSISAETQGLAVTIKMVRVILLVPLLLIVPYILGQNTSKKNDKKLHIPWFAFGFLVVVLLNSYIFIWSEGLIPEENLISIIEGLQYICNVCLVFAMVALGLQVDFKKFISSGGKAFTLALILFVILIGGGFLLVRFLI
ncbi:putative sulfate exporter family transporter [Helicobacter sp. 13S00477-4]|uniref:YeiH family protein n=1 Tax=Helicobacter sp. 13S00477-4 TaxID=1905759 RepID=UPI000BA5FE3D|nr:putative sulfate exporter family transporter [Helicobacter sp. 13S00477-4]PAF51607.1 hypothetical protein BKH44_05175 [Helicobacter sp. 13S00477-4]